MEEAWFVTFIDTRYFSCIGCQVACEWQLFNSWTREPYALLDDGKVDVGRQFRVYNSLTVCWTNDEQNVRSKPVGGKVV